MRLSNIGWNLCGLTVPLAVAAATVPALIDRLGREGFGLLALAWGLLTYAGALDLGIGRALTQLLARYRGDGDLRNVRAAFATATRITTVSGVSGGLLIALLSLFADPIWVGATSTPPDQFRFAVLLMAVALPAQAMSATYRGVNEAFENFRSISLLRVVLGIINFGGPYVVSRYTGNVALCVAVLVASRVLALFVYRRLAVRCLVGVPSVSAYSKHLARSLWSFGGWVTVSSVVSPVLVQADRFMIGALISASAVTVYVLPYEVVSQSLVIVGAVSSVAFPAIARSMREDPTGWRRLFLRWLGRIAFLMALVSATIAVVLPDLLRYWLGGTLDASSIHVGQVLCLGVFANSVGSMYYAMLHANGRADLTARLHLAELPIYLLVLSALIREFGVIGAAWGWVGRMAADAMMLAWLGRRR